MSSDSWLQHLAGSFIVFDGPDGSGKSTQLKRFVALCAENHVPLHEVREPGGTAVGEQIRKILLDPASEMSLKCEMLLYMASRAQLVEHVIAPALARNELVIADRFISSTLAYQGAAGGLPISEILAVGNVAIGSHWPDLIIIFDVDEITAAKRMAGVGKDRKNNSAAAAGQPSLFADRLELRGLDYQRRVREGFLAQAGEQPDRYVVINAAADADAVFANLLSALKKRFGAS